MRIRDYLIGALTGIFLTLIPLKTYVLRSDLKFQEILFSKKIEISYNTDKKT